MTRNDLASTGFSTPDSCGVTIAGSALHGRDLGIRQWFHGVELARVPLEGCAKARIVVGARAVRVRGWAGPGQSGRRKERGQIHSSLGCQGL